MTKQLECHFLAMFNHQETRRFSGLQTSDAQPYRQGSRRQQRLAINAKLLNSILTEAIWN